MNELEKAGFNMPGPYRGIEELSGKGIENLRLGFFMI